MNYLHALRSVPSSTLLLGPVTADRCTLLLPTKLARIRLILVVLLDGETAQFPLLLVFDPIQKQAFGLMDGFEEDADTRILDLERIVLHSSNEPLDDWQRFGNLVYASSTRDETVLVRLHLLFEGLDVMSVLAPPRPLTEIVFAEFRSRAPVHAAMKERHRLPSDFVVRLEADGAPSNVRITGRTNRWLLEAERVLEVPSSQPEQPDWGAMLTQSRLAALQDAVGMHADEAGPPPPLTPPPPLPHSPPRARLIHVPDATRDSMKAARAKALRARRNEKLAVFREDELHIKRVGVDRTILLDDDPRFRSKWEHLTPAQRAEIMHVHPNDVHRWDLVEVDSEPFGRHFESRPTHFVLPDGSIQELPDLPPRFFGRFGPGVVVARLAPCSLADPTAEPPLSAEVLGRGIFAVATLPSGYRFGYQGVVFPAEIYEASIQNEQGIYGSDGSRCIEILGDVNERVQKRQRYQLDSKWHPQSVGAFANHLPGHHLNARITIFAGFPGAIKTMRRIQPGEEIFVSYGGDYGLPDAGLMTPVERDAWRISHPSVPRAPQYDWQTVPGFEGAMTLSEFLAMASCKQANRAVHVWRREHLRVAEDAGPEDPDGEEREKEREEETDGEFRPGRSKRKKKGGKGG